MSVCVIWKPVASFSHFVRFYYIVFFFFYNYGKACFVFALFLSRFLLVRKLWHVERRDANLTCRSQQACHGYSWLNGKEVRVHGGKKNKTY